MCEDPHGWCQVSGKSALIPDYDVAALANNKALEQALFVENERAQVTLNSIADAVTCTDAFGNINFLNLVAQKMCGWTSEEAAGRSLSEVFRIIDSATRQPVRDPLRMAVKQDKPVGPYVDRVLVRRDGVEYPIESSGAPIRDRAGRIVGMVIVFHDVSAARAMSVLMTHSAQHDVVTGLPNRVLLNDRITQAIVLARRETNSLSCFLKPPIRKMRPRALRRFFFRSADPTPSGDRICLSMAASASASIRETERMPKP